MWSAAPRSAEEGAEEITALICSLPLSYRPTARPPPIRSRVYVGEGMTVTSQRATEPSVNTDALGLQGAESPRCVHRYLRSAGQTVFVQPLSPLAPMTLPSAPVVSPPTVDHLAARTHQTSGGVVAP